MLEDQPLDLSVRVGDYAELTTNDTHNGNSPDRGDYDNHDDMHQQQHCEDMIEDYSSGSSATAAAAAAMRLRGLITASSTTGEYSQCDDRNTCSEDSDDSCSDNNHKDAGSTRSRSRPPGTKPYKKNLMRRYREFFFFLFIKLLIWLSRDYTDVTNQEPGKQCCDLFASGRFITANKRL